MGKGPEAGEFNLAGGQGVGAQEEQRQAKEFGGNQLKPPWATCGVWDFIKGERRSLWGVELGTEF